MSRILRRSLVPLVMVAAIILATAVPFGAERTAITSLGPGYGSVAIERGAVGSVLAKSNVDPSGSSAVAPTSSPAATTAPPTQFYASPTGASTGDGSIDHPWDLTTALNAKSVVVPGTTLFLRGGTYSGAFVSHLQGTQTSPVVVRSYPGEWAVIDGGTIPAAPLDIEGSDVTFRDFEVMKSDPNRRSSQTMNKPTDNSRGKWSGVWVVGLRTKLIDLVVHDAGDGIGLWAQSGGSEIEGCIVFNNGWLGADKGWGHGIYVQNLLGMKHITNNVVFDNYGVGLHAYDATRHLQDIDVDGLTTFGDGTPAGRPVNNVLIGSVPGPTDNITLSNSVSYHEPGLNTQNATIGYPYSSNQYAGYVDLNNDSFIGGSSSVLVRGWQKTNITQNVMYPEPPKQRPAQLVSLLPRQSGMSGSLSDYTWDNNTYLDPTKTASPFNAMLNKLWRNLSLAQWQSQTGFDASSTDSPTLPTAPSVSVRPDTYTPGRAFVTVVNLANALTASVDLQNAGLQSGQRFQILDVQDLSGPPVYTGVYDGSSVTVPLVSTLAMQPIGETQYHVAHTSRMLGVFLVAPVG